MLNHALHGVLGRNELKAAKALPPLSDFWGSLVPFLTRNEKLALSSVLPLQFFFFFDCLSRIDIYWGFWLTQCSLPNGGWSTPSSEYESIILPCSSEIILHLNVPRHFIEMSFCREQQLLPQHGSASSWTMNSQQLVPLNQAPSKITS